jgi:hypothetical protein
VLLSRREKERMVVKLAEESRTTREIAKDVHMSLKTIGEILNKVTGDDVANEEIEKQAKMKKLSPYAQAFRMFRDKKDLADVAIELDLDAPTVLCYYGDYLRLRGMGALFRTYDEIGDDLTLFLHLFRRIKKEGLSKQDIAELVETQSLLSDLRKRADLYNKHIWNLHAKKQQMEREIGILSGVSG